MEEAKTKEEQIEELSQKLGKLRTRTGTYRHGYDGPVQWWKDEEYLGLLEQIEETKAAMAELRK